MFESMSDVLICMIILGGFIFCEFFSEKILLYLILMS